MKIILAIIAVIRFVYGDLVNYGNQMGPPFIFSNRNMSETNNTGAVANGLLRIYYGEEVTGSHEIPWQAALTIEDYEFIPETRTFIYLDTNTTIGTHPCGATLISETHLISAAHCLKYYDEETESYFYAKIVYVKLGVHDKALGNKGIVVSQFKWHELWDGGINGIFNNDISILWLPGSYKNFFGGENNTRLHWVEMEIVYCHTEHSETDSSHICARGRRSPGQGYGDTCFGDSGGPLYINHGGPRGENILVGITTYGSDDCGSGSGVYMRVTSFMPFILAHVPAAELDIV